MLRFFKDSFGMTVSVVMALTLSMCMAVVGVVRNPSGVFTLEMLLRNWGTAFLTITIISILLPVKLWGDKAAGSLGLANERLAFRLVSNLVPTLIFNTITTCVMVGVNIEGGFASPHYWQGVAGDLIPMFIASYLLSLAAERIGCRIAMKAAESPERQPECPMPQ